MAVCGLDGRGEGPRGAHLDAACVELASRSPSAKAARRRTDGHSCAPAWLVGRRTALEFVVAGGPDQIGLPAGFARAHARERAGPGRSGMERKTAIAVQADS
jgi:hypothetical protein